MKLFISAAVVHRHLNNKLLIYLNDRRNLHLEKFQDLYFSPHVLGMMKIRGWNKGHVARMRETRTIYKVLVRIS
jgi:hypothetical protein